MGPLKNQSGLAAAEAVLILVIVGILGFTGWYVYHSQTAANKNYSPTSSGNPTFKNNSKKASTSTSTQNLLKISELGVQVTIPAELGTVTYVAIPDTTGRFGLTDSKILAVDSTCTGVQAPIGTVSISDVQLTGGGAGPTVSQLLSNGKYIVIHGNSGAVCNDQVNNAGLSSNGTISMLSAIKTATLIK